MTKNYKAIFEAVESTLLRVGSRNLPEKQIRENLRGFAMLEGKAFSDAEHYRKMVEIIFYSGFRASTVDAKLATIRKHFPDYESVARYRRDKVSEILRDPKMIRNRHKVEACVANASAFKAIICEYGSFQKYIESFAPKESFENLMLLKEELEYRFDGLGRITGYHFLTDIGLPVLKPDRVIARIFKRLGLIENEEQLLKTVIQGRKFAKETGHPIRYIDIVFVVYGQMETADFGLARGICLEANPSCELCGAKQFCEYYAERSERTKRQARE